LAIIGHTLMSAPRGVARRREYWNCLYSGHVELKRMVSSYPNILLN
jgi:hypothetical protein